MSEGTFSDVMSRIMYSENNNDPDKIAFIERLMLAMAGCRPNFSDWLSADRLHEIIYMYYVTKTNHNHLGTHWLNSDILRRHRNKNRLDENAIWRDL